MGKRISSESTKEGLLSGDLSVYLTSAQREVLRMLVVERLSPKHITSIRSTTPQATYKLMKQLRKKGVLTITNDAVDEIGVACEPNQPSPPRLRQIRLHGESFRIRILHILNREKYLEKLGKGNLVLTVDGNTVMCYARAITIYSKTSFFGETAMAATGKSCDYWAKFISMLENDLKIILLKPRSQNIQRTKAQYAKINGKLSTMAEIRGQAGIRVYTTDDAKLWFMTDKSFGSNEDETVNGRTAEEDMNDVIEPFFNDLRDNRPPLNSELATLMEHLSQIQEREFKKWEVYSQNIVAHIGAVKSLETAVDRLTNAVESFVKFTMENKG